MADDQDSFVETTSTGWLSRIGQSLVGVLVGLIGLVLAIICLYWNEGRAVDAATALKEGLGTVVSVAASPVNPAREGKLVHVTGALEAAAPARDQALGVTAPGQLRLRRVVEMYQWTESKHSQTTTELGGSETTRTVYDYRKSWSESPVASDQFRIPAGHGNPQMPLRSATTAAPGIHLGDFRVGAELVEQLDAFQPLTPDAAGPAAKGFRAGDDGFYRGNDPANPRVGDLRLHFEAVPSQEVSVVAGQVSGTLAPYNASNGYEIDLIAPGVKPAAALFKAAQEDEAILTWIIRGAGFVGVLVCFMLLFQPLAVVVSVLPFLETLVGGGAFLLSLGLAIPVTLITIAVAWVAHRPLLAGALIVGGLAAMFLLSRAGGKKAPAGAA